MSTQTPFGPRLAVGMVGVLIAAMMAGLNNRVGVLGLADVRGNLGWGLDEASWLSTVYSASTPPENSSPCHSPHGSRSRFRSAASMSRW